MAGESRSQSSNPRNAAGSGAGNSRAFPVLIPQGALAGQPDVPLNRPVTTVGSNETARLHLVSRTVSKGHAIFVNSGNGTYVADLASRTGVLVNGKLVKDAELKNADRIQIGKFVFRYRGASTSASANSASSVPHAPPASVILVGSSPVAVTSKVVQIGRREGSDISMPDDAAVSAAHAVIFEMDGAWHIRDIGSRTGTKVNGSSVHQQQLNFGDRISIGSSTILFQPGVAVVEPEPAFDPQDSGAPLSLDELPAEDAIPVEEVEHVREVEEPVASDDGDWKSAFPLPVEEVEASHSSPEPVEIHANTEAAEPIEELDAIPLEEVAAEPVAELEPVEAVDAVEQPVELEPELKAEPELNLEPELEPEPVAQVAEQLPVSEDETDLFEPSGFVADEPVVEPAGEAVPSLPAGAITESETETLDAPIELAATTNVFDSPGREAGDEPVESITEAVIPEETATEPVEIETFDATSGISDAVMPASETAERPAETIAVEADSSDIESAFTAEPAPAESIAQAPIEPIAIETGPEPVEPVVTVEVAQLAGETEVNEIPVAETPASEALASTTPSDEPATEPQPVVETVEAEAPAVEELAIAPEPVVAVESVAAVEPVVAHEPAVVPEPQPIPAAEPVAVSSAVPVIPAAVVVPQELVAEVDDFVFVPGVEPVDVNAVPDVLFWGDDELDAAAEQAVVAAKQPAAPATPVLPAVEPIDSAGVQPAVDEKPAPAATDSEAIEPIGSVESTESVEPVDNEIAFAAEEIAPASVDSEPAAPAEKQAEAMPGDVMSSDAASFDAEPTEPRATEPRATEPPATEPEASAVEMAESADAQPVVEDAAVIDEVADELPQPIENEPGHSASEQTTEVAAEVAPEAAPAVAPVEEPLEFAIETPAGISAGVASVAAVSAITTVATLAATAESMIEISPAMEAMASIFAEARHQLDEPIPADNLTETESTAVATDDAVVHTVTDTVAGTVTESLPLEPALPSADPQQIPVETPDLEAAVSEGAVEAVAIEPETNTTADAEAIDAESGPTESGPTESGPTESGPTESTPTESAVDVSTDPIAIEPAVEVVSAEVLQAAEEPVEDFIDPAAPPVVVDVPAPSEWSALSTVDEGLAEITSTETTSHEITSHEITSAEIIGPDELTSEPQAIEEVEALDEIAPQEDEPSFDDLEFVEPESAAEIAPEPVEAVEELEFLEPEVDETDQPSAPVVESIAAEPNDLEFLEFIDTPAPAAEMPTAETSPPPQAQPAVVQTPPVDKAAPQASPPQAEPQTPQPQTPQPSAPQPRVAKGKPTGPPLFGFDFEGGSFLGGMPLPLNVPLETSVAATAAAAAAPAAAALNTAATALTGLAAITQTPTTPPNQARRPKKPASPGQPAKQPPATTAPAVGGPAVNGPEVNGPALPGLISDARVPWEQGPVIPPAAPRAKGRPATPAKPLTTTFNLPGASPRTAEVFSQMETPIGVEVFGGRPGDPNQFVVPNSKDTAADIAGDIIAQPADSKAGSALAKGSPADPVEYQPGRKPRRSRLPLLILALIGLPALIWYLSYTFMPVGNELVASIRYTGLMNAPAEAAHDFHLNQEQRLASDEVRTNAIAALGPGTPPGFLQDRDDYIQSMSHDLTWNDKAGMLELTLDTPDPKAGSAQLKAVLTALVQKDQDLKATSQQLREDADLAAAEVRALSAKSEKLVAEHIDLARQAEDKPDAGALAQADTDVTALKQHWTDTDLIVQATQAKLKSLAEQDPSKPADTSDDPILVGLQKQLQPVAEQIRTLKSSGGVSAASTPGLGTDVSVGATTQPASSDGADPLLSILQAKADSIQKQIDERKADLAAMSAVDPAQRAVNISRQIENLSVKLTGYQHDAADAKAAYDAAVTRSASYHTQLAAALAADARKELVHDQIDQNERDRRKAANEQAAKEAAYSSCIVVNGTPMLSPPKVLTDLRRPTFLLGTSIAVFLVGVMIIGELRRPRLITNVPRPAAAPLVNPPTRVIPWPQPHEIAGLKEPVAEQMLV
jgi:pSer/pThr/pTyr-binding forkhead associated (FHA) protein